jgi:hypothetical protein
VLSGYHFLIKINMHFQNGFSEINPDLKPIGPTVWHIHKSGHLCGRIWAFSDFTILGFGGFMLEAFYGGGRNRASGTRWGPYRVECTGPPPPTSEVKRRRARLVLVRGAAR